MRNFSNFLAITILLFLISCDIAGCLVSFGTFGCGSSSIPDPLLKVELPQEPLIIAPSQNITISNVGEKDSKLEWSISSNQNWLIATPSSGEIIAGEESMVVNLSLDSSLLNSAKQAIVNVQGGRGGSSIFDIFLGCVTNAGSIDTQVNQDNRSLEDLYANQIIVRYKETAALTTLQNLITTMENTYGYRTLRSSYAQGPSLIAVEGDPESLIDQLNSDPNVAYAELNGHLELALTPNDPLFSHQWNMQDFGLQQAWDIETGTTKGSDPVVIAILDSAIQTGHEDLKNKMLPGCDFHNNDSDPSSPILSNAHGTHVAGIAAAVGNNNLGVAGVAFGNGIEILPVKIFDDRGTDGRFFDLANAIRWSAGLEVTGYVPNPNPAKILNMSLGAAGQSLTLDEAVADAANAGALIFAASGNAGSSTAILTPANAPDALAIGSVDSDFERSSFSNFDGTGGKSVDLLGPGGFLTTSNVFNCVGVNSSAILSTFPVDNYSCLAGTSMSAPFVSGVAALIWHQNPNFSAEQVKNRLFETTFFDSSWGNGKSLEHGFGVVCADKALDGATLCGK